MRKPIDIRKEVEHDLCASWVPDETRDVMWRKAWSDSHAYGEGEVRMNYEDLMDIVRTLEPKEVSNDPT